MTKDGGVYTNTAYGVSDVTLNMALKAGIGKVTLEVAEEAAATPDHSRVTKVASSFR